MQASCYGRSMRVSARSVRRILLIALGAFALVLAGCGSSDAEAEPTAAATEVAATPGADPTAAPGNDGGTRVAADGDRVSVHYHGTLDDGEVFDSSRERDPLQFVVGTGQVIAGFDDAVQGLGVGDSVTVRLPPAEAYGEVDESRILEIPAAQAPEGLAVGDQVSVSGAPATVTGVTEETVTVDANHPLAGQSLTFEIELIEIE